MLGRSFSSSGPRTSRPARWIFVSFPLLFAAPNLAAELSIEYELIALSEVTPIPGGVGAFTGFGDKPAIDANGNVVFSATGGSTPSASFQSGIYTAVGPCCQKVADRNTLVPGGGGITFDVFRGADHHDIDGGRVAFLADISGSGTQLGVYSNVGQPSAGSLVEVAVADGLDWSSVADPWVDGTTVALRGRQVVPDADTILLWDGSSSYVDPGAGYIVSPGTQASLSEGILIFRRFKSGSSQLGLYDNGFYDVLVTLNATPIPGHPGMTFNNVNNYPVVDRGGLDVAFRGNGSGGLLGVYKSVDGGALEQVADNATPVPGEVSGSGDQVFSLFSEDGIALADRQVVFWAQGQSGLEGIYTDIGGELAVLVDNDLNGVLLINGVPQQVLRLALSHKSLARTAGGYAVVFKASLANGQTAIIRAAVDDGAPDPQGQFTVYKDFSDNNTASVSITASCSSGTVTNSPQLAREGQPAVFTVTGALPGTTCTASEPTVPSGYTRNQTDCQNGDPLNGSCTIINTLNSTSGSFTVFKDYSDNSTTWVNIHLSCSSGTVTNTPQLAREGTPAVFSITGTAPGTTCTASEPVPPSGYTKNEADCQNGDPLNGSCTIVNTLDGTSGTFTVNKDFSDNNTASVSITASCSSGTVINSPQLAREGQPAVFTVTGALPGTTCTASEPTVPSGYTRNQTDCQNGDPLNGSCTITNTLNSTSSNFTVYKDFSNNSTASVSVTASCSSGTVTNSPQTAREGVPAVFNVTGALPGATCTASEPSVPAGYSRNQSDCQIAKPIGGSCIIVNTLVPPAQETTVFNENFEDGNASGWSTNGIVDVNGDQSIGQFALQLRDTSSAERAVSTAGFSSVSVSARMAASGLEKDDSCHAELSTNGGSSWSTIVQLNDGDDNGSFNTGSLNPAAASNNPNLRVRFRSTGGQSSDYCWGDEVVVLGTPGAGSAGSFLVRKDFSNDSLASVTVNLTCTSGTVTNSPQLASEASPAIFYIQGQSAGATCSASETVPAGYTANQAGCQDGDPVNGTCTIVNTLNPTADTFTVFKDFSDNNAASVSITASCSSGTVTNNPRLASEGAPAVFSISGASGGTTCTATEPTVPTGYTRNQTDCQNGDPLNGSCTIINTLNTTSGSFTVFKDFSDNNSAGVSITASCSSGTVTNSPQTAREGQPAVFNVTGAQPGTTCTASEPTVPAGYTRNQVDCQNGDPLNGSCTIINTLIPPSPVDIVRTNFETGQAEGWSLTGGAVVDNAVAIGQFALLVENDGTNSVRSVSTVGYSGVGVTMNLAAQGLQRDDVCHAELSTNGGSTWTTVLEVGDGLDDGSFRSATVSPAAASNNANLRLRVRMVGKGKGDRCWGDDMVIRGTAQSGAQSSSKDSRGAVLAGPTGTEPLTAPLAATGVRADIGSYLEKSLITGSFSGGFDPGFDNLIGDGHIDRVWLGYDLLMNGGAALASAERAAFTVPPGAAAPDHQFSGWLELHGSSDEALPDLDIQLVQVGNHLLPLARDAASDRVTEWVVVMDTGRVWRESGDYGFSRASLPFMLVQPGGDCVQDGVLTFLFSDDGATSRTAYRISNGGCGDAPVDRWGMLETAYLPAAVDAEALGLEAILECAADNWLPLVQGRGGFSVMLLEDGTLNYVLRDDEGLLWLDAARPEVTIDSLCD